MLGYLHGISTGSPCQPCQNDHELMLSSNSASQSVRLAYYASSKRFVEGLGARSQPFRQMPRLPKVPCAWALKSRPQGRRMHRSLCQVRRRGRRHGMAKCKKPARPRLWVLTRTDHFQLPITAPPPREAALSILIMAVPFIAQCRQILGILGRRRARSVQSPKLVA